MAAFLGYDTPVRSESGPYTTLLDATQFQELVSRSQLNRGRPIDEMLQDWIDKHQSSPDAALRDATSSTN
ncbi:MAG TPA: hypothetical protein VIQ30_07595 [Pseudonocardia sp.]